MKPPLIKVQYYATYYYASAVRNILTDQLSYMRALDAFYGDEAYLELVEPFKRHSAFHSFIWFVVDSLLSEETADVDLEERQRTLKNFSAVPGALADLRPTTLPIEEAFRAHLLEEITFETWLAEQERSFAEATPDDLDDFLRELRHGQAYEDLVRQFSEEVFFVLFQNRTLLMLFNEMIASEVINTDYTMLDSEVQRYFKENGTLRRVAAPGWARRAVFFRDRGRCVICRCDLSGVLSINSSENYDHIVPLARGGLNDISNLQLLCRPCNEKKSGGEPVTSCDYEAWYDMEGSEAA